MKYVTLNNGLKMPILGFGVFQIPNENAVKIEPAHRTSRATASESKSHPKIGWLDPII